MDAAAIRIAEVVCEAWDLVAEFEVAGGGRLRTELVAVQAQLCSLAERTCDEDAAAAAGGAAAELQRALLPAHPSRAVRAA